MGYSHGVSSRAVYQETGPNCLTAIFGLNLQEVFGYFDRFYLETENEFHSFPFRVTPQRSRKGGIVDRRVGFRPYSPMRSHMRFKLAQLFCRENVALVFSHPNLSAQKIVLLYPLHILLFF